MQALSGKDDEHRWMNDEVLPDLQGQSLTAQDTSRAPGPVPDSPECIVAAFRCETSLGVDCPCLCIGAKEMSLLLLPLVFVNM